MLPSTSTKTATVITSSANVRGRISNSSLLFKLNQGNLWLPLYHNGVLNLEFLSDRVAVKGQEGARKGILKHGTRVPYGRLKLNDYLLRPFSQHSRCAMVIPRSKCDTVPHIIKAHWALGRVVVNLVA